MLHGQLSSCHSHVLPNLLAVVLANLQKQICVERITTFSGAQDWLLVEGKAKRKEWRDD